MLIVGLTGGIGSGKSTVANAFAALSVNIIDADEIAHTLVQPNTAILAAISKQFGDDVLLADGSLNRAHLREIVFNDRAALTWLESHLHPLIQATINQRIQQLNSHYCLVVIPLLIEKKALQATVDRILIIDCPEALQIKRAKIRDGCNEQMIKAIMQQQASRAERLAQADDIIENNTDLASLEQAVLSQHQRYLQLAESKLA